MAAAIDKHVHMLVHAAFEPSFRVKYSRVEEVRQPADIEHPLFREALIRHWRADAPLEIASLADVPAGTGMGSSGAFVVCLLKALACARGTTIAPAPLAEAACEIEIEILREPVGKQDQYVAAHGGFRGYIFHRDGAVTVESLELSPATLGRLRRQLMLFFTGETRSASAILADQDIRSRSDDPAMVANLDRTKAIGREVCALLEAGDVDGFAELMHEHWLNKRRRSPAIADARTDALYKLARRYGAIGGKLLGAGGGGFLLVVSRSPERTRSAMLGEGAVEIPFEFDFRGAVATTVA